MLHVCLRLHVAHRAQIGSWETRFVIHSGSDDSVLSNKKKSKIFRPNCWMHSVSLSLSFIPSLTAPMPIDMEWIIKILRECSWYICSDGSIENSDALQTKHSECVECVATVDPILLTNFDCLKNVRLQEKLKTSEGIDAITMIGACRRRQWHRRCGRHFKQLQFDSIVTGVTRYECCVHDARSHFAYLIKRNHKLHFMQ